MKEGRRRLAKGWANPTHASREVQEPPNNDGEKPEPGKNRRLGGGEYSPKVANLAALDALEQLMVAVDQEQPSLLVSLFDDVFRAYQATFRMLPIDPERLEEGLGNLVPQGAYSFKALLLLAPQDAAANFLLNSLQTWTDRYSLTKAPSFLDIALLTLLEWTGWPIRDADVWWSLPFVLRDDPDGLGETPRLTLSLIPWRPVRETKSEARLRLIAEAKALIEGHLEERDKIALAQQLRRNQVKRPPRSDDRDHFQWAARVLIFGASGAEVARTANVDRRMVASAVADIAALIDWISP